MKRFNTFTIAVASVLFAFTVMSGGVAGAVPVITNGLVAAYEFNGNADDVSGNGNNGVVIGATLTADRFGNVGSAYSFFYPIKEIPLQKSQSNRSIVESLGRDSSIIVKESSVCARPQPHSQ